MFYESENDSIYSSTTTELYPIENADDINETEDSVIKQSLINRKNLYESELKHLKLYIQCLKAKIDLIDEILEEELE